MIDVIALKRVCRHVTHLSCQLGLGSRTRAVLAPADVVVGAGDDAGPGRMPREVADLALAKLAVEVALLLLVLD